MYKSKAAPLSSKEMHNMSTIGDSSTSPNEMSLIPTFITVNACQTVVMNLRLEKKNRPHLLVVE
ncbi:hypothetical protein M378DRAFT_167706 [Amanita muscaria Koide BX008]|uniref:Uncharacterized protein n=1 Tax=Amanita muscaria (strain Koide BX008) TaxID=946122 RepID=A0A0C2T2N6_AMAMK|nr:hypothetical protein M378DRAFT_167706 [Amanita muscaria Koide BX008]